MEDVCHKPPSHGNRGRISCICKHREQNYYKSLFVTWDLPEFVIVPKLTEAVCEIEMQGGISHTQKSNA